MAFKKSIGTNQMRLHEERFFFIFISLILSLILMPQGVQQVKALSGTYSEDFTTTDYNDPSQTNATGWGEGIINLPKKNITLIGEYDTTGIAMGVVVEGEYTYITDGQSGLQVVNTTDPTNPTLAGTYDTSGFAMDVVVEGNYVYIADNDSGLQVVNIVDPTNPTLTDTYDTSGFAMDVVVEGNYVYIADSDSGLQVVNIVNPTNPTWAGTYDSPGAAMGVVVEGDYAYVADKDSGLQVVNITDPTNPTWMVTYDTPGAAMDVVVEGDYAYIADNDSGVQVVNITIPTDPTWAGTYDTPGAAMEIVVDGNYAYIADNDSGLQVMKITDPTDPTWAGTYDTPGTSNNVFLDGDHAYIADGNRGLQVVTIADSTPPTYVGSYDTPGAARDVVVEGDYAYIADYEQYISHINSGLIIMNITDPTNPTFLSSFTTPGLCQGIDVAGDYAYIADDDYLQVINITDPSNPTLTSSYSSISYADEIDVVGDYAYIAESLNGLHVVNITDPSNPIFAGSYDTEGFASGIFVTGDYAYLAVRDGLSDPGEGLLILNIVDPSNPTFVSSYNTADEPWAVVVKGDLAYIADDSSGLQILNVANPATPTWLGSFDTGDSARDVAVVGDYAYMADRWNGFKIVNIADPTNPTYVGGYSTNYPDGVAVAGDYAFLANDLTGLYVFEVRRNRNRQFEEAALVQSSTIHSLTEATFVNATLTSSESLPPNTAISYYLSADNGLHWEQVTPGSEHVFTNTGSELKWKAILTTNHPLRTPKISFLSIDYISLLNAPPLFSPEDASFTNDNTPTFTWETISGASNYLFQLDTTPSFSSANLINETVDSLVYTPTAMPDGLWYWRVAGIDTDQVIGFYPTQRSLIIDTILPIINHPADRIFEQGTSGYNIIWYPTDANPYSYNVTRNGVLLIDGPWLDDNITISIEGLSVGIYSFVCNVYDKANNSRTDNVIVTVTDTTSPTLDQPDDITYEKGATGNILTWTPSDANPSSFLVERDGAAVVGGPWDGETITVNVDGLPVGTYTYTCTVYDQGSNNISDTAVVIVTEIVVDTTPPTLDQPDDITYEEGATSNILTWTPSDANPSSFLVERDGAAVVGGPWDGETITVNVDGLPVGTYTYTCTVYDQGSNNISDTAVVIVTEIVVDTTPPTLDHPDDITYEEGATSNILTWTPSDVNPSSFLVERDGAAVVGGPWDGQVLIVNVDGLPVGTYTFICTVYDQTGNMASDTVVVIVEKVEPVVDTTPPTLNHPDDITYEEGTTDHTLTWIPSDINPSDFLVMRDGAVIVGGSWNGEAITVSVDGLTIGTYSYTCTVYDQAGNNINDTILVTVFDASAPTIDHPSDIIYVEGMIGYSIIWHPSDKHPSNYIVKMNNSVVDSGVWDGSSITISVEGLSPNNYTFICTVFDEAGNSVSDTVLVSVSSIPSSSSPWSTVIMTLAAIGLIVILRSIGMKPRK